MGTGGSTPVPSSAAYRLACPSGTERRGIGELGPTNRRGSRGSPEPWAPQVSVSRSCPAPQLPLLRGCGNPVGTGRAGNAVVPPFAAIFFRCRAKVPTFPGPGILSNPVISANSLILGFNTDLLRIFSEISTLGSQFCGCRSAKENSSAENGFRPRAL